MGGHMSIDLNPAGIGAFRELEKPSDGRISERNMERHANSREPLWRAALAQAMEQKETIARDMYHGRGFWWPALAPLTAQERTAIIAEVRHMWGVPERKR